MDNVCLDFGCIPPAEFHDIVNALDQAYAWRSICHSPKIQDAPRTVAMCPYSLTSIVHRKLCQPDVAFATTDGPPAGHHVGNVRDLLKAFVLAT